MNFKHIVLAIAVACGTVQAANVTPEVTSLEHVPQKVLLVGNSYTYYNCGLFDYMWGFAGDRAIDLQTQMATIAGADFDWHDVERLIDPPGKSWSFVFKKDENGRLFDVVVLQGNSLAPIDERMKDNYREWAAKHVKTIREHGSEPVFFMTWARKDKPEMTQQLAEATLAVANENHALCIPVGLAFKRALEEDPDLNLIMPDKSHPTAIGSYLASAVIFSALTKTSLVGSNFLGGCEKPLDPKIADAMQRVAWETVVDFYGWKK